MILALESSGTQAFSALEPGGLVLPVGPHDIAENWLPLLEKHLASTGRSFGEIRAVAVTLGPGSFTGLRIGLATAKTLAWAGKIPLFGYPLPDLCAAVLNERIGRARRRILLDARRQGVYTADYACPEDGDRPVRQGDMLDWPLSRWPALFDGVDGAPVEYGGILPDELSGRIPSPHVFHAVGRDEILAHLCRWSREDLAAKKPGLDPLTALPIYIREGVVAAPPKV